MKKLILLGVIALGSWSIYATAKIVTQPVRIIVSDQTAYTEVGVDKIRTAVKTALQAAYPTAKLEKAFVNEKKEYKLEISLGDQKATVYSDVNGNWLKI